jgi:hypothetical protein
MLSESDRNEQLQVLADLRAIKAQLMRVMEL